MKKDALDIEVFVYNTMVFGTIIAQNEALAVRERADFTASNGIQILSDELPGMYKRRLNIRGWDRSKDKSVFTRFFPTEKEADTYSKMLKVAISEFNSKFTDKSNVTNRIRQVI